MPTLTLGTTDTADYGNNFNGTTNTTGSVEFTFANSGQDITLSLDGYDVDTTGELRILVNGVVVTNLGAGLNDDLASYQLLIEAGRMTGTAGELNTITIEQTVSTSETWGVTNLVLDPVERLLTLGATDTTDYGNQFNGQTDIDGDVSFVFARTGSDLVLNLNGYDVDFNNEIKVILNGGSSLFLAAGVNNGLQAYAININDTSLTGTSGELNTITFSQNLNDTFKWGVTDLNLVTASPPPPPPPPPPNPQTHLLLDTTETGQFGNKFGTATDTDGDAVFVFDRTGGDVRLSFDGYDVDFNDEIKILINGVQHSFLAQGVNDGFAAYQIVISDATLTGNVGDHNTITVEQNLNDTFKWGVTNLLLENFSPPPPPPPPGNPQTALTFGVTETGQFGNKFGTADDTDGDAVFTFARTGSDLELSFDGYDIDWADEVRVLVNGVEHSFLPAGVNNDLAPYTILISDASLTGSSGTTNTVTIEQNLNDTYKWGVTNLVIDTPSSPPPPPPPPGNPQTPLVLGVTETGEYGNKFGTADDTDGDAVFTFEKTGSDLQLSFSGYDIDWANEVKILLNGVQHSFVGVGVNNGLSAHQIVISDASLTGSSGTVNTVTFEQNLNDTYKWGVTSLLLETASPPPPPPPPPGNPQTPLTLGATETGQFGNKFGTADDTDGDAVFTFAKTGADLQLSFDGYDIDWANEVKVLVNGVQHAFLPAGVNDGLAPYQILIEDSLLTGSSGTTNTVTIEQNLNDTYKWGVTNLLLETASPPPPPPPPPGNPQTALTLGVTETGEYGNKFGTADDTDGDAVFTFTRTGDNLVLNLDGYDVDFHDEIKVLLNGVQHGFLAVGVNNSFSAHVVNITDASLTGDTGTVNTITFEQNLNDTFKWGVTNLLLETEVV